VRRQRRLLTKSGRLSEWRNPVSDCMQGWIIQGIILRFITISESDTYYLVRRLSCQTVNPDHFIGYFVKW